MNPGKSKMRSERTDEELLVRYLLGNLSEAEEVAIEDRAFADPEFLAALDAAEADLIDSYVRGELSTSEHAPFENRFLSSASRRNKVEFARALAQITTEAAQSKQSAIRPTLFSVIRGWNLGLQFAAGLAALLCIVCTSWLALQNSEMRSRVAVLEQQRNQLQARERVLQNGDRSTQEPTVASLILLPGLSRAQSRIEQLRLTASAQIARIQIQLDARDDYSQFRAELRTQRGQEVLTLSNLPRRGTTTGYAVSFDVPASALTKGQYELSLKALSGRQTAVDIGYYYFEVQTAKTSPAEKGSSPSPVQ